MWKSSGGRSSASRFHLLLQPTKSFSQTGRREARIPSALFQQLAQNARGSNPIWRQPLFRYGSGVVVLGGTGYYVTHLEHVAITDRRRFMNVSAEDEAAISKQSYNEIMTQYRGQLLPESHPQTKFVKKVAGPLIRASGLTNLNWEVHVIQSDQAVCSGFLNSAGKGANATRMHSLFLAGRSSYSQVYCLSRRTRTASQLFWDMR